jgi:hypothetical protein
MQRACFGIFEAAIKRRQVCSLILVDDKHHIKVGEPGYPVAAVERAQERCIILCW